jgi:uncharacterized membrane protein YedE/YeeE
LPAKIPFFQYDWKKEIWNLFFVFGIFLGGIITAMYFKNDAAVVVDPKLITELSAYGIVDFSGLVPAEIFSWASLATPRGFILMVIGGFLGGCTSGHAIMGLSNLQLPSLIATISFMAGGFIMANLILPYILSL